MTNKEVKKHGRIYTPDFLVKTILDFGAYSTPEILGKHVIDNSCGDGAFLKEIVQRYCNIFLHLNSDLLELKQHLETFIHGIELDENECFKCKKNLDDIVNVFGITEVRWDIMNADTLTVDEYNGRMDFVFGNPPYVRVHNLDNSYDNAKRFRFAEKGMIDLFIVFFEIGFRMLSTIGQMCLITPSSWLNSKAGSALRKHILLHQNLVSVIDLEHFQPFEATTYTLISRFTSKNNIENIEYSIFDGNKIRFIESLPIASINIAGDFFLSTHKELSLLRKIHLFYSNNFVSVKNGFATLADKIFIGDFSFNEGCMIEVLKASTGKWSKCIYPYDTTGKPLSIDDIQAYKQTYSYLLDYKNQLSKNKDIAGNNNWYLFGRTQAINDVSRNKIAVNTIVKNTKSIRLEFVPAGKGVYSGLYILTKIDFKTIQELIISEDFINYIKVLKNYKSGGYYTYSSKDLERYLNYKLSEKYGQQRISQSHLSFV